MSPADINYATAPEPATVDGPAVLRPTWLPDIDFHRPTTLGELLRLVGAGYCPLAGGTDALLVAAQRGEPRLLAWTGGVAQLLAFQPDGDTLRIGSAVTLGEIIRSKVFRAAAPAVADGAHVVGSVQLRHQATLSGNICTASPAGDTLPGLLVHDAVLELASRAENRHIALREFLLGPGRTALRADEVVCAVRISALRPSEGSAYRRHTQRQALDLAFAGVAARVRFGADGRTVDDLRLALGAVGPTAFIATEAATRLTGRPLTDEALGACAEAAAQTCTPISDHRASAGYRRQLIKALIIDVVTEAASRAVAGQGQDEPR